MKNIYWILFMHLFVINAAFTQNKNFADSRVLILYGKNYTQNTKYNILNPNKSFFASIKSLKGNEPTCELLRNKILSYYPNYYMFHFYLDSNQNKSDYYTVKIGLENKLIRKDSTMITMLLVDHIKKYYCKASSRNPLRKNPYLKSKIINLNYSDCYFMCIEFKDNWIKVKSIKVDGEDSTSTLYTGWLMWNNGTKIILDYPYVW